MLTNSGTQLTSLLTLSDWIYNLGYPLGLSLGRGLGLSSHRLMGNADGPLCPSTLPAGCQLGSSGCNLRPPPTDAPARGKEPETSWLSPVRKASHLLVQTWWLWTERRPLFCQLSLKAAADGTPFHHCRCKETRGITPSPALTFCLPGKQSVFDIVPYPLDRGGSHKGDQRTQPKAGGWVESGRAEHCRQRLEFTLQEVEALPVLRC